MSTVLPIRLPPEFATAAVVSGPERLGSEQRWRLRLPNGREALLGSLLPELARDESLRRRYVHDIERVQSRAVDGLAKILATGPQPDPRDPDAPPPWRLREEPRGESLAAWLERRAPAPVDEVAEIVAGLADVVGRIHDAGAVVRDLHPRHIVLGTREDGGLGAPTLTDIGLARVDILSSRTAASLILEGSPYASPEQLLRTTLDPRSDVFGLGVLLFQALTGQLPYGDGPALLRAHAEPPDIAAVRADTPPELAALIGRCLAPEPEARPESAAELALVLRGGRGSTSAALARTTCQSCGEPLRVGQRLCLACGKQAVIFQHGGGNSVYGINLVKATEDAAFMAKLRAFLGAIGHGSVPALNLLLGDRRMYSKDEQSRLRALPVRLFNSLSEGTARALAERMTADGFQVKVVKQHSASFSRQTKLALSITASAFVAAFIALAVAGAPGFVYIIFAILAAVVFGGIVIGANSSRKRLARTRPFMKLRAAPAALPASDPLVARLASKLDARTPDDVREQIGELALLVQRLVDHRATLHEARAGGAAAELDRVTEPVEPLVALIEEYADRLRAIDGELRELDEGAMVRALAASEARGEPRSKRTAVLAGLDRLRTLEDQRGEVFHHLLETSSLLRRAVDLGLEIHDPDTEHERRVQLALQRL